MLRLNPLRHQLASTSPIRLQGVVAAWRVKGTGGPHDPRERLRTLVQSEYGVANAVLCGSGTEALVLAFEEAERLVGRRTTVVLPAFSCFDVAAAAVRFGRPVSFYDVDPHTLGPDPDSLSAALVGETRTVLIASLFGLPVNWAEIDPILAGAGAFVVEDAAQGHGATWKGTPLGAHGRLGVLSFGRGKGWTGASGGAVLVRDPQDVDEGLGAGLAPPASKANILLNAAAHWSLGRPSVYGLPRAVPGLGLGETRYRPACMPRTMSRAAAALALDGKAIADGWIRARRAAAARYEELLAEIGLEGVPTRPAQSECGYGRYPVILPRGMQSFANASAALRLGAAPGYPRPLPELDPLLALCSSKDERWAGAEFLVRNLVTFPTHPLASPAEREHLVRLLSSRG